MNTRSSLTWLGGKGRLASRIIKSFPSASSYKAFVEPFVGSATILFAKPRYNHLEVINDRNRRLINFWLAVRNDVEYLQWKLKTLPYSEAVFKQYRESLNQREPLEAIEEAARWYYVNRSTIAGHIDSKKGWDYTAPQAKIVYGVPSSATSYHHAVALLQVISERLQDVQIHDWDFEKIITKYQSRQTFIYSDQPYIGSEGYYEIDDTPLFTMDDHRRLAALLNQTPSMVAVSHYEHPLLDELYPTSKWRRVTFLSHKELSRMNNTLQGTREVLLCNYPTPTQSLWNDNDVDIDSEGGHVA